MTDRTDKVIGIVKDLTDPEQEIVLDYLRRLFPRHPLEQAWGTTAEAILTAIARSPDLTQRGIRGILAEAEFERLVLPTLDTHGWKATEIGGDGAYDFKIIKGGTAVRVQVKLQRREVGVPKEYAVTKRAVLRGAPAKLYVVEVQKTRSGRKGDENTRPYRFGDFDILAVNLHPSTGDWSRFMYTVANWLIPRQQRDLIEIMQPVPASPDTYWTNDAAQCVGWFLNGGKRTLYAR